MKTLGVFLILGALILGLSSCSSLDMETAGASKTSSQKY